MLSFCNPFSCIQHKIPLPLIIILWSVRLIEYLIFGMVSDFLRLHILCICWQGKVSREEIARICIAALESPYACDKTFEVCYSCEAFCHEIYLSLLMYGCGKIAKGIDLVKFDVHMMRQIQLWDALDFFLYKQFTWMIFIFARTFCQLYVGVCFGIHNSMNYVKLWNVRTCYFCTELWNVEEEKPLP